MSSPAESMGDTQDDMYMVLFATGNTPSRPLALPGRCRLAHRRGPWDLVGDLATVGQKTRSSQGEGYTAPMGRRFGLRSSDCCPQRAQAIGVAATVLRNKGVTDIRIVSDAAIGWVGKEWAFRVALQSAKQSYEVGIVGYQRASRFVITECRARRSANIAVSRSWSLSSQG